MAARRVALRCVSGFAFLSGLLSGLLFLSCGLSCGGAKAPVKEPAKCDMQSVTLSVIAAPDLNPTPDGEARSVQVRIYQLKSDIRLQNAPFEDVWKDEKAALGDDIIKSDEVAIFPETRTEVKFERDESAQTVAAVALFQSPKGRSWFSSFELPPPPGKGSCGMPDCPDGQCDGGGPVRDPKFTVWVQGARVEDGSDHQADKPKRGRLRVVRLAPAGGSEGKGASAPKGTKL